MDTITNTAKRSIESREDFTDDAGNVTRLSIYTYHDRDRKRIVTSITRAMIERGFVRVRIPTDCFNTRSLDFPIERYSFRVLETRHGVAMAEYASIGTSAYRDWAMRAGQ